MSEQSIQIETPPRARGWLAPAVMLLLSLAFFIWTGSGPDPSYALPWGWTASGWVIPSRGLALLLVAAVILFAVLSRIAWRLMADLPAPRVRRTTTAEILALAIAVAARLAIVLLWTPLPLSATGIAPTNPAAILASRETMTGLDILTVLALLFAARRAGRNPWWVLLYALHPLTLMEIAGNGSYVVLALLPVALTPAIAFTLPARLKTVAAASLAIAAIIVVSMTASPAPFDSLPALLLFGSQRAEWLTLTAAQAFFQTIVLAIAWRRKWTLPRTLSHSTVLLLLSLTIITPPMVLLVLILLPFTWNRAAWVMSLAVFVAYAAVPASELTHRWAVPPILVMLAWTPVLIVELQDLTTEAIAAFRFRPARPPTTDHHHKSLTT